jgi:hypothetical protein
VQGELANGKQLPAESLVEPYIAGHHKKPLPVHVVQLVSATNEAGQLLEYVIFMVAEVHREAEDWHVPAVSVIGPVATGHQTKLLLVHDVQLVNKDGFAAGHEVEDEMGERGQEVDADWHKPALSLCELLTVVGHQL